MTVNTNPGKPSDPASAPAWNPETGRWRVRVDRTFLADCEACDVFTPVPELENRLDQGWFLYVVLDLSVRDLHEVYQRAYLYWDGFRDDEQAYLAELSEGGKRTIQWIKQDLDGTELLASWED
jgi:hypothetical protein